MGEKTRSQTRTTTTVVTPQPQGESGSQTSQTDPCAFIRFQIAPGDDKDLVIVAKSAIPWRLYTTDTTTNPPTNTFIKSGIVAASKKVLIPVPLSVADANPELTLAVGWDKGPDGEYRITSYRVRFFKIDDKKNLGYRLVRLGYVEGHLDKLVDVTKVFATPPVRDKKVVGLAEQQAVQQFQVDNGLSVLPVIMSRMESKLTT
ncbi:MAG: hypothetical protein U0271_01725 [Polyangiaceae bacterium]